MLLKFSKEFISLPSVFLSTSGALETFLHDVLASRTCKRSLFFSVTFWIIPVKITCARRINYKRLLKEVCDLCLPLALGICTLSIFSACEIGLLEQKPDAKTIFLGLLNLWEIFRFWGFFCDYC